MNPTDDYEPVSGLLAKFEERTGREGLALVLISYGADNKIYCSSALKDFTDDRVDGDAKREVSAAVRRWLRDFEREEYLEPESAES